MRSFFSEHMDTYPRRLQGNPDSPFSGHETRTLEEGALLACRLRFINSTQDLNVEVVLWLLVTRVPEYSL
jgi:hypothetical protein